jgi:hypothetical protein
MIVALIFIAKTPKVNLLNRCGGIDLAYTA